MQGETWLNRNPQETSPTNIDDHLIANIVNVVVRNIEWLGDIFMSKKGLSVRNVLGDGNCGIYAIMLGLVENRIMPIQSISLNDIATANMF